MALKIFSTSHFIRTFLPHFITTKLLPTNTEIILFMRIISSDFLMKEKGPADSEKN